MRAGRLVYRDPLSRGSLKLAARSRRDTELRGVLGTESGLRGRKIRHAVDQHRPLALEMIGEQQGGWTLAEAHHRHARAERLNPPGDLCAERTLEVLGLGRDIARRRIEEVEAPEQGQWPCFSMPEWLPLPRVAANC